MRQSQRVREDEFRDSDPGNSVELGVLLSVRLLLPVLNSNYPLKTYLYSFISHRNALDGKAVEEVFKEMKLHRGLDVDIPFL